VFVSFRLLLSRKGCSYLGGRARFSQALSGASKEAQVFRPDRCFVSQEICSGLSGMSALS
jgi:hypothetical protein